MIKREWNRRNLLTRGGGAAALGLGVFIPWARSQEVRKDIHELAPGEFTWHPERSPAGPVAVITSIPEQRVHVYRNGVRIGVATCSTGKPGHATPTGVFVVLQKDKNHRSSTYNNAPMPNMNRLTWGGIALHAGKLPGYPASHGCVRLPSDFSARLFSVTHIGTPVIISGSHTDPWDLVHPGLVLGAYAATEFDDAVTHLRGKSHPSDWPDDQGGPITSVVASAGDRTITLIENDREIATGRLNISGESPLGEHVFVLRGADGQREGLAWQGISHHIDPAQPIAREERLINRLSADPAFLQAMTARMHPGMVLVVTDLPSHPDARSGSDFVIMTDA